MKCIFLSARNVCNLQHKLPTQNVSKEILTGFSSQSKRPTLSFAVLHLKMPWVRLRKYPGLHLEYPEFCSPWSILSFWQGIHLESQEGSEYLQHFGIARGQGGSQVLFAHILVATLRFAIIGTFCKWVPEWETVPERTRHRYVKMKRENKNNALDFCCCMPINVNSPLGYFMFRHSNWFVCMHTIHLVSFLLPVLSMFRQKSSTKLRKPKDCMSKTQQHDLHPQISNFVSIAVEATTQSDRSFFLKWGMPPRYERLG